MAKAANVPVLPVALKTDFWGNGRLLKDLGRVDPRREIYFEFGAPFLVNDIKDANQQLIEFIAGRLRSWPAAGG